MVYHATMSMSMSMTTDRPTEIHGSARAADDVEAPGLTRIQLPPWSWWMLDIDGVEDTAERTATHRESPDIISTWTAEALETMRGTGQIVGLAR